MAYIALVSKARTQTLSSLSQKILALSVFMHTCVLALNAFVNTAAYVIWSSKISVKLKNMIFVFVFVLFCFFFLHVLLVLGYCLGFHLVKTPQRLGNWFQRCKQLKDWTNNRKQKKLSALFGFILKTAFASYDSFCLITLHMLSYNVSDHRPIVELSHFRSLHGGSLHSTSRVLPSANSFEEERARGGAKYNNFQNVSCI